MLLARHHLAALAGLVVLATPAATAADSLASPRSEPWTFAVVADLHTPHDGSVSPSLQHLVATLVALEPRFVVVAGDSTNGNLRDGPVRQRMARRWWAALRTTLEPLRDAGIPVLPVAGNHDSYLPAQRAAYAEAFADLARWAAPLAVSAREAAPGTVALDAAPFSYSVELDGVHLSLTHVVDQGLDPVVARWLAADLAATQAPLRIVVGHVPLSSVMGRPAPRLLAELGGALTSGGADVYIAGHEHLVWDEIVALPGGDVRQVIVGTARGTYNYGPTPAAQKRAGCRRRGRDVRCTQPHGGDAFALRHGGIPRRLIQHQRVSFTLFTVDGERLTATPMALDDGELVRFALAGD